MRLADVGYAARVVYQGKVGRALWFNDDGTRAVEFGDGERWAVDWSREVEVAEGDEDES